MFTGVVDTVRSPGDKQQIFISKVALSGNNFSKIQQKNMPAGLICYVSPEDERPFVGRQVCVKGKLCNFSRATNPGQFDQGRYYQIRGYDALLYDAKIMSKSETYGLRELLFRFRTMWGNVYEGCMNARDSSMLKAMVLGDKDGLDEAWRSLYQRSGQAHLLAISALHMNVVSGVVYEVLKRLFRRKRLCAVLTMVIVVLYGEMTQMSSSTKRAVIMFLLYMVAGVCGRCYDLMTSMAVAAVLSLVANPLLIYDAGFLLSYFAVMGVGLGLPIIRPLRQKMADRGGILKRVEQMKLLDGLCASFVVSGFTLPLSLYYFYQYPPYAPFLSLILIPLMGVLLTLSIAVGLLGMGLLSVPLPGPLLWKVCGFFGQFCHLILLFFEKLCKLPEQLWQVSHNKMIAPTLYLGQPELWEIGAYYGALFLLLGIYYGGKRMGRRRRRCALTLGSLVLLVFAGAVLQNRPKDLAITVMDVGQGDCILIQSKGADILVDGGSSDEKSVGQYRILPCLKALGVSKLDRILITHTDADHINGIRELIELAGSGGIEIGGIYMSENSIRSEAGQRLIQTAEEKQIKTEKVGRGDLIRQGKLSMEILYPQKEEVGEPNELSVVSRLSYGDFSMLLTGDIEGDGEIRLVEMLGENGGCDVYKSAHHGSRGTGHLPLLHKIRPSVSIVSCGTGYGHPHIEAVERMEEVGSRIFVTKEVGAVRIETDGHAIKINTFHAK